MAFDYNEFLKSILQPKQDENLTKELTPAQMYSTKPSDEPIIEAQPTPPQPIVAPIKTTPVQSAPEIKLPEVSNEPTLEAKLKEAADRRDDAMQKAAIIEGIAGLANYMSASASGQKPVELKSHMDMVQKRMDQQTQDVIEQDAAKMSDPKSEISKQYRLAATNAGLRVPETTSANVLKAMLPSLMSAKKSEDMLKAHQAATQQAMSQFQQQTIETKKRYAELRERDKLDKDVKTLADRLDKSQIPTQVGFLQRIEDTLNKYKTSIEDKNPKSDLPGIGPMDNLKPDFLLSNDGLELRQNIQGLANYLLKQRSGAAVSDQEYARFLKESGAGKFQNNKSVLSGLRKMKADLQNQVRNIESVDDDAKKAYIERTGQDLPSKLLNQIGQQKEETIKIKQPVTGQIRNIPKSKLDEALKAGGQLVE